MYYAPDMGKRETIDEVTGLSLTDMEAAGDDLYAHRDHAAGDVVTSETAGAIRSVVSVRFSREELDEVAAAATAAGLPLSTYIRNTALATAVAVDLDAARRGLQAAIRALDEVSRSLGAAA